MKHKPIKLEARMKLREEYLNKTGAGVLSVVDGKATGNYTDDYVYWLESKIKTANSDYAKCEDCGSENVYVNSVCQECDAEWTTSHIG